MKSPIFTKSIISWAFYDWACSAFNAIMTTFIFSTYFTQHVAENAIEGTAQWGQAISISAVITAIISPIFGAVADHEGRRKPWLALFTFLIIISSALLWYVKPNHQYIFFALFFVVIAEMSLEVAFVFYNAMLRDLVPQSYIGRVSGWAWGLGYAGGLVSLIFCLLLFVGNQFDWLHLNTQNAENIRIVAPFSALWLLVFSIPLFVYTPDRPRFNISFTQSVRLGMNKLIRTFMRARQYKNIFKYLIAHMIYTDGLNTAFAFGGIYAAGTFNLNMGEIIYYGIGMNIAAGIGAVMFGWIDDWFGSKITVLWALFIMMWGGVLMVAVSSVHWFLVASFLVGICVGPIQAASRSLLIHIAPAEMITEMFGLYVLSGRVTAFLGPLLLGLFTAWFNSQRVGMSTILFFLLIGGILLLFVKVPRNRVQAQLL